MMRLTGRVAIVTGGAGGLGSATVERLAAEGAKVVVADINEAGAKAIAKKQGDPAIAIRYDARDNASVQAMIEGTVAHFGRIDILCNNAALLTPETLASDTTATEIPLETWDAVMAVNVRSHLVASRCAIPHMIRVGKGSIINIASGSGLAGDVARIAYGTSKAALMSLTRYVATQYGKQGVRCNAIAPGLILTETAKMATPELLELMSHHTLTPQLGEPRDVAALAAFLASDDAAYITGQTISCDGGLYAHQPQTAEVNAFFRAQSH